MGGRTGFAAAAAAALALTDVMAADGRKFSVSAQTRDLDEFRSIARLAKDLGATHVDACQIEPSMWMWDLDRADPYPNWGLQNPTVFKFVVPKALEKYFDVAYAKRNFETLARRAAILREFGLKASFNGMEPAYFPEQAYLDHPAWRGPRCDQPRRARKEYYAPCFDNAEVRALYFEAVRVLCTACPFDAFVFLTNDSGGGLCWAEGLYPGENGPHACLKTPIGQRIATYLSVFQDAARAAGLGDVAAGVRHIGDADERQALSYLKPGQSVNTRTAAGLTQTVGAGIGWYSDLTFPVSLLPRLDVYARGLQRIADAPADAHVSIGFRSADDRDAIDFVRMFYGKIGKGPAGRAAALQAFAATRVGEEDAPELCEIWQDIERIVERLFQYQTGGHIFMLGTVHQRWLTRPFVAFPEELKPEEKDYYRAYQFQAQEESDADDLTDLQGNKWLKGTAASCLLRMLSWPTLPVFDRMIASAERLAARHAKEPYGKDLTLLALRLRAWKCVFRNAVDAVAFQDLMDRADRAHKPVDKSQDIGEQGDVQLVRVNQIVRDEIDMSYELADMIEQAPGRLFDTAAEPAFTSVMQFEPTLAASLRKRARIMEAHRRDFLRLYRSLNR